MQTQNGKIIFETEESDMGWQYPNGSMQEALWHFKSSYLEPGPVIKDYFNQMHQAIF